MSWFVHGNGERLRFNFDLHTDDRCIAGRAQRHECTKLYERTDMRRAQLIGSAPFCWEILPATAESSNRLLENHGLLSAARGKTRGFAVLAYDRLRGTEAAIVLHHSEFDFAWEFFLEILRNERLEYLVSIEFPGFGRPGVQSDLPTFDGFFGGAPYLATAATFSLGLRGRSRPR
jgi:hypothetical protein